MTIDDFFTQFITAQLVEKLGPDFDKFRGYIKRLNETNRNLSEKIEKLTEEVKSYSSRFIALENSIDEINDKQWEMMRKIDKIESDGKSYLNRTSLGAILSGINKKNGEFGQQTNKKMADLEDKIAEISLGYKGLIDRNAELELKIKELSQKNNEKEVKNGKFQRSVNRDELFGQGENSIQKGQTDNTISMFNNWAANPVSIIPSGFAYLTGDFRIRTNQQELIETPEETKWIINRGGNKKYLLPNPNFFDQRTNILELYKMDLNLLKVRGKNKIKIITPCEISSSGFIEFLGELQILP